MCVHGEWWCFASLATNEKLCKKFLEQLNQQSPQEEGNNWACRVVRSFFTWFNRLVHGTVRLARRRLLIKDVSRRVDDEQTVNGAFSVDFVDSKLDAVLCIAANACEKWSNEFFLLYAMSNFLRSRAKFFSFADVLCYLLLHDYMA